MAVGPSFRETEPCLVVPNPDRAVDLARHQEGSLGGGQETYGVHKGSREGHVKEPLFGLQRPQFDRTVSVVAGHKATIWGGDHRGCGALAVIPFPELGTCRDRPEVNLAVVGAGQKCAALLRPQQRLH